MKYCIFFITAILLSFCFSTRSTYKEGSHVSFAVVGDVMCHSAQLRSAYQSDCDCYKFYSTFAPVRPYLSNVDISIANLETTLPGDSNLYSGFPRFGSPDSLAAALKRLGIDVLALANNHSLDKGSQGLIRTMERVNDMGFYHMGTYLSQKHWENDRVLVIKRRGIRVALLNYTFGTNGLYPRNGVKVNLMQKRIIAEDLRLAHSKKVDATIVYYHFGEEYSRYPNQQQKRYVHHAFRHGADVVLGAHPHIVQPYRMWNVKDIYGRQRKRLAAYSLGNFVSNQLWRYTRGGIIFYFDLVKDSRATREKKILIRNVHYEPIWVYVDYNKKKQVYYILPIKEYLQNDQLLRLPSSSHRKMLWFLRNIQRHLD